MNGLQLLRADEVADMLGVPVATVRYWRHMGTGPKSAKLGRRIVYREADVQAWVDQQFDDAAASAS